MSSIGLRARMGRLLISLPESVRERVVPGRAGYRMDDVPPPIQPAGAGQSLLMGPANSAGQGNAWARAIARMSGWDARNIAIVPEDDPFRFPADRVVPAVVAARSTRWARDQQQQARRFDRVIVESLRPIFGRAHQADPVRQIQALRAAGVDVALLWHGSDIRSPRRNAEWEEWSPFADAALPDTRVLQEQTDRAAAAADELGLPEFVSTADLLRDRPRAVWVPVVIDPAQWPLQRWEPATRLRVLHAPSRRRLKGSESILGALQRLHEENVIDLTLAERVAHTHMAQLVRSADVVLDQFALGIYGVAALEAMASGRLVISHVADDVRAAAKSACGRDLPILEATPATLSEVLRAVAAEPERFRDFVDRGREFVVDLHDGRRSAAALIGSGAR